MKRKLVLLILVTALPAAATLALLWVGRQGTPSGVVEPRRGPLVEAVYGLGTVTAKRSYQLRLGITASIKEILVREGEAVRKGQPLISFDEGTTPRAPFSGTIVSVPFKPGETVFPQTPIMTLMDLSDLYVAVALEQQGALRVTPGQRALLSFESLRGLKIEGKVRTIFPNEGQFIVHIDIAKLPEGVLPGMTSDVAIEVAKREDALLIPVGAIAAGKIVVLRGGAREKIDVQVGIVDGEWAEVKGGGLRAGDRIVLRGR